jgi:isoquinoline 1-oxidoreductase subunit beta
MNRRPLSDMIPDLALSRRSLIVGGSVAGGLAIAWALWPRNFPPNLVAAPGEAILNAWIKIGKDGHVIIVVPQVEMGQGSYTLIPQIIADELGADWRTVGVEPAPLNPVYANQLFGKEWQDGPFATEPLQVTGGSSSERSFAVAARQAGAAARILLCKAAAARWEADWRACETSQGFVTRGDDRIRFGELVDEAAAQTLPKDIPLRTDREGRISGRGVNRLDIPAKIDGSANFAADIRLPDMLYAAIRQGPLGDSRLIKADKGAADRISGVLQIVETDRWIAAVATNWWAANRALDVMRPTFETRGTLAEDRNIGAALSQALDGDGTRIAEAGDLAGVFAGARLIKAEYDVGLAPHAALEPMTATASIDGDKMQLNRTPTTGSVPPRGGTGDWNRRSECHRSPNARRRIIWPQI